MNGRGTRARFYRKLRKEELQKNFFGNKKDAEMGRTGVKT